VTKDIRDRHAKAMAVGSSFDWGTFIAAVLPVLLTLLGTI
jgi:hypothetical protein